MSQEFGLKAPPHSVEAEQSVIGGVMLHGPAFDDVADIVGRDDFFRRDHREIWEAICDLDKSGSTFDYVSVGEWLMQRGKLEETGGMQYIGRLAANVPSVANIKRYAAIVADRARERRALAALVEAESVIRGASPTDEKLDKAQALLQGASERRSSNGPMMVSDLLPSWLDSLEKRYERGGEIVGLRTGFNDLDNLTAGLQPANLIIVAGRPSMGKTTFTLNIAENVALFGLPVLMFSMEMSRNDLIDKNQASIGKVLLDRIKKGTLEEEHWPKVTAAMARMKEAPLMYDDTPALSPMELRARARRVKRKHGLGLIVVDYLQLMKVPGYRGDNRTNEVAEISRSLKALAKELNVPVIALSQLNRDVERRADNRPRMADLKESGSIEQDADIIMFVYRDEVYDKDSSHRGTAEINIAKHRNGPIGMVRLVTRLELSRFENMA